MEKKTSIAELEEKIRQLEAKVAQSKAADDAVDPCGQFSSLCIESAPYGIMAHDDKGRILIFNSRLEKISGYRQEEIPDIKTWIEKLYTDEEYRKLVIEERKKAGSEEKLRKREAIITTKAGDKSLCRFSSLLLKSGIRIIFIDKVAEQRQTEELLNESEERFRMLSEAAIEAIIIHKDGVLLKANDQFFKMFGYHPEELLGTQVVPRVIAGESIEVVKKKIESKVSTPYEAMGRRKDGDKFPILCHAKMIKYQGSEVRVVAISDLSHQKKSEQALRESEENFRTMINDTLALICRFMPDGTLTFVNDLYCSYFNKERNDLIGQNFFQFIPKRERQEVRQHFTSLNQQKAMITYEHQVIAADGILRWQQWTDRALFTADGKVTEYQSVGIDITDLKGTEIALRESEEKFRTVSEQSPNMIFINTGGKIVYVNQKCEEIMGYKKEEFYSPEFDFLTLIAPESIETVRSSFKKHNAGQEVSPYEYSLINKKGKRIEVIITTKLINFEGHQAILGIVTDISNRKKAEIALKEKDKKMEQQARHLEEVNTALKVLLEHREQEKQELEENLLTNIKKLVFPYLEKLDKGKLNPESQTYLDIIRSNLKDVISSMASTLSSNYPALTPTELQIADMIKHGKTSKEIATMLNVSDKAVAFHRGNIRKKLGLTNKKRNLRTYLQSFPQ
jgi:PAS domain S-box-containing protein